MRAQHLPGGKPNREAADAFDHVIVGDDMPGSIPKEARARLRRAILSLGCFERAGASHHLHHGWRCVLEDLDRCAFDVGQAAARLDRARRRGGKHPAIDVGLREINSEHNEKYGNHYSREAVAHRRPPRSLDATSIRVMKRFR